MKIVQRLTVIMLLPALGSGRWNGADAVRESDGDRGWDREAMRTVRERPATIQGFASGIDTVASTSSSSATMTIGRLLRGGSKVGDELPVDKTIATIDAKVPAEDELARRGLFSLTGGATQDTLVWDPDANGGTWAMSRRMTAELAYL